MNDDDMTENEDSLSDKKIRLGQELLFRGLRPDLSFPPAEQNSRVVLIIHNI